MNWDTYLSFLPDVPGVPGGRRFQQTRAITRLYCCDPLAFTIEVRVQAGEISETRLTSDSTAGALGLTSWLRTRELGETSVTFATAA